MIHAPYSEWGTRSMLTVRYTLYAHSEVHAPCSQWGTHSMLTVKYMLHVHSQYVLHTHCEVRVPCSQWGTRFIFTVRYVLHVHSEVCAPCSQWEKCQNSAKITKISKSTSTSTPEGIILLTVLMFKFFLLHSIYLCIHAWHGICVEFREQLVEVGALLPFGLLILIFMWKHLSGSLSHFKSNSFASKQKNEHNSIICTHAFKPFTYFLMSWKVFCNL